MTREEAKKLLHEKTINIKTIVDKIYDDFVSMTCKNCRYYEENKNECYRFNDYNNFELDKKEIEDDVYFVITCDYDEYGSVEFKVTPNFGCNKFERKENERN